MFGKDLFHFGGIRLGVMLEIGSRWQIDATIYTVESGDSSHGNVLLGYPPSAVDSRHLHSRFSNHLLSSGTRIRSGL